MNFCKCSEMQLERVGCECYAERVFVWTRGYALGSLPAWRLLLRRVACFIGFHDTYEAAPWNCYGDTIRARCCDYERSTNCR